MLASSCHDIEEREATDVAVEAEKSDWAVGRVVVIGVRGFSLPSPAASGEADTTGDGCERSSGVLSFSSSLLSLICRTNMEQEPASSAAKGVEGVQGVEGMSRASSASMLCGGRDTDIDDRSDDRQR
jgi:hypothetical protein